MMGGPPRRSPWPAGSASLTSWRSFVLGFTGFHQMFRGDAAAVKALAEEEIVLCEEHGYPYGARGDICYAAGPTASLGEAPRAPLTSKRGIAQYRDTGAIVGFAHFLTVLVEALTRVGRGAEALQATEEALGIVRRTGNRYLNEAEEAFATALRLARDGRSQALELRAALGWSRLLLRRGRRAEATALLTPFVSPARDHSEAPELQAARDLLCAAGAAPPTPTTIT